MDAKQQLSTLFLPKAVAVIGASAIDGKAGNIVLRNLLAGGFRGKIFPVNPKGGWICNLEVLKNIAEIPQDSRPLDMAIICLPARDALEALSALATLPVRSVIALTAGFKDTGGEGAFLEEKLKNMADSHNIVLLGPNSLGLFNGAADLNATLMPGQPAKGSLGFFSQSGALGAAMLDWAEKENIGFSSFISLGNKTLLDESAILSYLDEDPNTKVIAGYLENVQNGSAFMHAAQLVTRKKPVIILRGGRSASGAKAASSHSGESIGPDVAYRAAFRKCGIIQAEKIEDMLILARAFSGQPLPRGSALAIIGNAGGPGIIAADACEAYGLKMAELSTGTLRALRGIFPAHSSVFNPIDGMGDATAEDIGKAVDIVLQDSAVHVALVILAAGQKADAAETAAGLSALSHKHGKPLFCCFLGGLGAAAGQKILHEAAVPCYNFPEQAIRGIAAMYSYNVWRHAPLPVEVCYRRDLNRARKVVDEAKAAGIVSLAEFQAQELLKAYEMPTLEARLARNSESAVQIAKQIGWPVALKIASPQILHKTDVNGVMLGLSNPAEVREAFLKITAHTTRLRPEAHIAGCLVQAMAPAGSRELAISFKRDARFGPLVFFGVGGAYMESLRDTSCRLAPLSVYDAHSMIREIRWFPLLAGARGQKAVQFTALEDILLIMSQLAKDFPEIQEVVCKPVLASEQGAVVADIHVELKSV